MEKKLSKEKKKDPFEEVLEILIAYEEDLPSKKSKEEFEF